MKTPTSLVHERIDDVPFAHRPSPEVSASGSLLQAPTVFQTHVSDGFHGPDQNSLYTVQIFRELTVTVMHYPPGASKWNLIEHRMFSLISENWAGEPLVSYETMLNFIRRTRSATGFHCKAWLDTAPYAIGIKVTKEEKEAVRLKRRKVLPRWNYTIWPRKKLQTK